MSSDERESLRSRLKRWSEQHGDHDRQRGLDKAARDIDRVREALDEARRMEHQGRALHDTFHRERDRERSRRSGKRPLDVEAIAAAAVAIADAQGVEEVSMRKVAAVLGAGTMSLYHYVRTKEDLLAAMDDLIMAEILVTPAELRGGWRKAMSGVARHTRDAYRRHPWALTVKNSGGAEPGINSLRHVEQSLAALAGTQLDFEQKMTVLIILDDYVFGHSLRAITNLEANNPAVEQEMAKVARFMEARLSETDFPMLRDALGEGSVDELIHRMAKAFNPDEWFEIGLEAVLDGLAKRFSIED